jgi:hypothetical protein
MVATTFALDTPLYVAGFVREIGVSKNWEWWVFLFGGMFTTFFFAKLWRRSDVLNDAEFIALRYSGREAAFLRGFRALYMGFIMNMLVAFRWGVYGSEAEFNRHGFEYMFISFGVVTAIWVTVTLLTKPCRAGKLREFYRKVRPAGPGWKIVTAQLDGESIVSPDRLSVACIGWLSANLATLSCLFTISKLLLGSPAAGGLWLGLCVVSSVVTVWAVRRMEDPRPLALPWRSASRGLAKAAEP